MPLSRVDSRSLIVAVLSPTNTGKTHRAVERMLEHDSGMIGLPLRLLAREVYDRITRQIGESPVALVTGEEKRIPKHPRYWVCTVEAMPMDREVDFVAVDEIQLATHPQRGHVFTDRLLHARGRRETWFLGAETMRPVVQELVPTAEIRRYGRLSSLRGMGSVTLGSLPPRTAVVVFSAPRVYELAERLRRRRGGAAVVLGALSPRARNAQVALYQAGEVQYMVATDAIGMGLNLDIDTVAFAELHKFDGREERGLQADELAQVAGRAGRYRNDGTFGTLKPTPSLAPGVVFAIENHVLAPVRSVYWRNSDLDKSSARALLESLRQRPHHPMLRMAEQAEDHTCLQKLIERDAIAARAHGTEAVTLLWEVCQIPDYRQLLLEHHLSLLSEVYLQASSSRGHLDPDWMHRQIKRIDDLDGDIETLMMRMAFIRTWTYIAHHSRWVLDAESWQARTRDIEERLSDALHERLVERFVDWKRKRRTVTAPGRAPAAGIKPSEPPPEEAISGPFRQLLHLRAAMESKPQPQQPSWVESVTEASHDRFEVDARGRILDGDRVLGVMTKGPDLLRPDVTVTLGSDVGAGDKLRIQRQLLAFARDYVSELLEPLRKDTAGQLSPAGRGLLYQIEQQLGTIVTRQAGEQIRLLSPRDRHVLRMLGVVVGQRLTYVPMLLKAKSVQQRSTLCSVYFGQHAAASMPRPGQVAVQAQPQISDQAYLSMGYARFGSRAIRADMAERIHQRLGKASRDGGFDLPAEVGRWLGCAREELKTVVQAFGYRETEPFRFERAFGRKRQGAAARRPSPAPR